MTSCLLTFEYRDCSSILLCDYLFLSQIRCRHTSYTRRPGTSDEPLALLLDPVAPSPVRDGPAVPGARVPVRRGGHGDIGRPDDPVGPAKLPPRRRRQVLLARVHAVLAVLAAELLEGALGHGPAVHVRGAAADGHQLRRPAARLGRPRLVLRAAELARDLLGEGPQGREACADHAACAFDYAPGACCSEGDCNFVSIPTPGHTKFALETYRWCRWGRTA